MPAKIVQVTNVYFEDGCANAWQPKTFHVVDDVSFVQLKKTDYKLTRALAEMCGVDTSALRYKDQPSLVNSLAYKRMQTARNAQANAICSAQQEAAASADTSSLFGSDATKVQVRSSTKRRKLDGMPATLDVDVGGVVIRMLFPELNELDLHIELSESNIFNFATAFKAIGCCADELSPKKRGYRTSGQHGVWKFGNTFVAKVEGKYKVSGKVREDDDGCDGWDCADGGLEELPEASASDCDADAADGGA